MSKEVIVQVQPAGLPSLPEWNLIKEQASYAIKSGFLPSAIKTPEQAITIALKGRELGIPMMQAFSHIHVIQGKPACSAELQLALIFRNCPGAVVDYVETSPKVCRIKAARPGRPLQEFSYTIEEAGNAKLLSKDPWKAYPAAMLRARCVSIVARALFPDAIAGMSYTPEELGADVNEEGEVTALPPPQVVAEQPAEEDGHQGADPGYRIPFGKYARRSLEEIAPVDLAAYVDYIEGKAEKEGKPLAGAVKEFIERASEHLAALEGAEVGGEFGKWEG